MAYGLHNLARMLPLTPRFLRLAVLALLLVAPIVSALDNREPNTTLVVPQVPPVYGYQTVNAFGNLTFSRPVAIVQQPGETNRLFIVEQKGLIHVITNLASPTRTLFMDISEEATGIVDDSDNEEGLLGMAFHPDWRNNRQFYLFYTINTTVNGVFGRYDRLARFEIDPVNPNAGLPGSEFPLISQFDRDSNHNGGDVHFGPDGYLYVSTGDEGGGGDNRNNSRFIDKNFFSAILRIDVDRKPGSLEPNAGQAVHRDVAGQGNGNAFYAIPPDNPFIGATSFNGQGVDQLTLRTEFWAVGLRNPWRMSFDPVTGLLYCADVGQGAREEVNIIEGGNDYGWKYKEGFIDYGGGIPANTVQESDLTPPIIDYPRTTSASTAIPGGHAQGTSVTGGVVYNGERFSQIQGHYVFGDAGSGRIFALRYNPDTGQAQSFQQLTSASQPVAFGIDPSNGDVLIARLGGTVSRLIYSSTPVTGDPLPLQLSQTGAFSDLATLTPEAGIVPYELNVPFWSDHAHKSRWFSIPDVNNTMTFSAAGNWQFPAGTVWIKHFELELTEGDPASRRRLETRFLVRNDDGVHGFTYRWNAGQTDADLVPETGVNEVLDIRNPDGSALRAQTWRYPSRSECLQCHTPAGGFAAGFNTVQLNRAHDYGQGAINQLTALSNVGYFDAPVANVATLPKLSRPEETGISLERRVRSYLQANCVACHQPGGPAQGNWDARIATATDEANLINGLLVNDQGDPANRVLAPGDLAHSELLRRISLRGAGQMPPVGSTILDPAGVALLTQWINALPQRQTFTDWQLAVFGFTTAPEAAPDFDGDGDGADNYLEWLTGTEHDNPDSVWRIDINANDETVGIGFDRIAERGFEVQFKPDLAPGESWQILDVPSNQPNFGSANAPAVVTDSLTNAPARYYRVRVFPQ
ncbi:MAG TPA: PQQ-dependent sugar dehydrogenase [Verrucomicrobiae bacterium]|nr:PQQ-dependent sugar dehydrogenase [Verrucomicrobiae bacterium]